MTVCVNECVWCEFVYVTVVYNGGVRLCVWEGYARHVSMWVHVGCVVMW